MLLDKINLKRALFVSPHTVLIVVVAKNIKLNILDENSVTRDVDERGR